MNHLDDSRLEEGRASAPEETCLACSGRLSVLAQQLDSSWRYSQLPCPQTTSHLCSRSFCLSSSPGRRSVSPISRFQGVPHGKVVMMRQFLVLVGVIAVVLCSLLLSMYVLDFMKFPELREHLSKILKILGIAAAAGLIIMLLVRAAEKKWLSTNFVRVLFFKRRRC